MNILKLPSPNFFAPGDMTESEVCALVAHGTSSAGVSSAIDWLRNPYSKVSSNYVISKAGVIYELVDPFAGKRAWCNGLVDKANYDKSLPWLVDCVRRNINPNWHTISIEHEATEQEMKQAARMTDRQFNSSIELVSYLLARTGLKASHETFVTHHQIAGNMKPTCPGVIFPPAYIEQLIKRHPELA